VVEAKTPATDHGAMAERQSRLLSRQQNMTEKNEKENESTSHRKRAGQPKKKKKCFAGASGQKRKYGARSQKRVFRKPFG